MKAIKCPNCGKINDGSTDFCIYCGTIYEEFHGDEDYSNILFIKTNDPNRKQAVKLNPMPERFSQGRQSYRFMILIGYIFAILGSILGFFFAAYLITRKDQNARKHGIIQLALLIIEFALVGVLIFTGQMDPNILLNPFNASNMANMTQMYNTSGNLSGSSNLTSLFGF